MFKGAISCTLLLSLLLGGCSRQPDEESLRHLLMSYPNMEESFKREGEYEFGFTSPDSISDVFEFYVDSLEALGFAIDSNPSTSRYAAIGGGQNRRLKAEFVGREIQYSVEVLILEFPNGSSQVAGNWQVEVDSSAVENPPGG